MEKWKESNIEDTSIQMIDGDRGKNYPKNSDFFSNGYCLFLNAGNVTKTGFSFSENSFITENKDRLLRKGRLERNDVVITTRGTVGNVALYDSSVPYEHLRINSGMLILKGGREILPEYLYYYLKGKRFQTQLSLYVSGSAQPQLPKSTLGKITISFPVELKVQKKICGILKSLDDKIAVNKKICENLEAQAQALFKHWFVDFAPFKDGKFVESELGLIPEGWRVGCLSDLLDIVKETTNQGERPELPYLPIDSIPMNTFLLSEVKDNSEAQSSLLLFKRDDILIGAMRVYFHRVIPAPFDGITRSTCFVLRPKIDDYFSFALCVANSNDAIRYAQKTSKGSTMPYAVWEGGLGSYCTIIPPKSILKDFNVLLKKDIELIQNMYFENNRLASLRDTLLPKLMSGQIKV